MSIRMMPIGSNTQSQTRFTCQSGHSTAAWLAFLKFSQPFSGVYRFKGAGKIRGVAGKQNVAVAANQPLTRFQVHSTVGSIDIHRCM